MVNQYFDKGGTSTQWSKDSLTTFIQHAVGNHSQRKQVRKIKQVGKKEVKL